MEFDIVVAVVIMMRDLCVWLVFIVADVLFMRHDCLQCDQNSTYNMVFIGIRWLFLRGDTAAGGLIMSRCEKDNATPLSEVRKRAKSSKTDKCIIGTYESMHS